MRNPHLFSADPSLAPFHFASVPSGRARILLSPQGSHEQNACETFFFYYPNTHPSQTRRIRPSKEDKTRQGGQDQTRRTGPSKEKESTLHFDGSLSLEKDKKKKVAKEEMEDEE